jgi:hypothetical protein
MYLKRQNVYSRPQLPSLYSVQVMISHRIIVALLVVSIKNGIQKYDIM